MINLDLKDRKILYELDINSRQPNSQIGKKVGLSKEVVNYRINRLLREGIILRFSTVINTYKLSYQKYKIYLQLQNATKNKIEEILQYLIHNKKTEWVAFCSGKWDIIIGYLVKDYYEFNNLLIELSDKYKEFILDKEITLTLGVPHYRKEWLLNRGLARIPEVDQSGATINYKLDKVDEEILKILANNARLPITEIAKLVKTTPRIISYRIRELIKNKIILIHRIFLDLNKLDYKFCKAFLYIKYDRDTLDRFFSYCSSNPNLTYLIKCIGPWEIELEFEIESFEEFIEQMQEIKEKFPGFIKKFDYVIILKEYKLDYYPECYKRFD